MIGRMWRGRTDADQADGYESVFRGVVLPELRDVEGCRGAYLLRRDDADGVEFVSLTLFDSLDAVRAFAGEDYDSAVISDEAAAVLRDYDTTAHFGSGAASRLATPLKNGPRRTVARHGIAAASS